MSHSTNNSMLIADSSENKNDLVDCNNADSEKAFWSDFAIWHVGNISCLMLMDYIYLYASLSDKDVIVKPDNDTFYVLEFYRLISDLYESTKPNKDSY